MKLTNQQQQVLTQIKEFMKNDSSVFILRGCAGTGKTTMVKQIADYVSTFKEEVFLMAPTGRAARILQEKTGFEATTIHKRIYESAGIKIEKGTDIADIKFKYHFPIKETKKQIVAIVDEASMISSRTQKQELFEFGTDNLMDDLLTFARPNFGGKIIFVGDPFQLPPVGDSASQALNANFFKTKNLKVEEAELTEVLRQGKDSLILKNATLIRELLKKEMRNQLVFKEKEAEVESLSPENFLPKYMEARKKSGRNDCVIISFSNRTTAIYNKEIRKELYGEEIPPLKVGDILMIVQNNYSLNKMNGEFVQVSSVGEETQQSAPVYVEEGGVKVRKNITLNFIKISITNTPQEPLECYLLKDLLNNEKATLSIDEEKALYINFCIRHKNLNPKSVAFADALQKDPFYNCLKAKYGYAVTGHKCQGGEWAKAFVDYTGRTGLSTDCLRWAYTATTRARKELYFCNLPKITPFSSFRIDAIQKCSKLKEEYRKLGTIEKSPFHDPNAPDYLHAKWMCIQRNLEFSPFRIDHIESKPYLEIYYIQTPNGIESYEIGYQKSGIFTKAKAKNITENSAIIGMMLDDERAMPLILDYHPSNELLENVYNLIRSCCDDLDIQITNVVERLEDYHVTFYFRTSNTASYIKIYISGKGFITYAKPMSLVGADDKKLVMLIEKIKNHFI